MDLRLSPAGYAALKAFEGFTTRSLALKNGRWLVGHGHVETSERAEPIGAEEAERLLAADVAVIERAIASVLMVNVTQSQFDALVSFTFSIGTGAFLQSDVLDALNAGDVIGAADAIGGWRLSGAGKTPVVLDALVRRRAAERAMFLTQDPVVPAPSPLVQPIATGDAPERRADRLATARLKAIFAAEPATARALAPPPVDLDAEESDDIGPLPSPPAPTPATRRDVWGLAGLGAFGAALLTVGLLALNRGGDTGGFAFLLFATPGAMAVIIALYYLARTDPPPN